MGKVTWRWLFLGVTALAIGAEVFSVVDGNDDTEPWTDLIVKFVPWEISALAIAGLAGWLAVHFGVRYWRKANGAKEYQNEE